MERAVYLIVRDPLDDERKLYVDSTCLIGRDLRRDVVLHDAEVSRSHAELRPCDGRWRLADLGSRNGTYVNGRRIVGPVDIGPGDELRLGRVHVSVRPVGRVGSPLPALV